MTMSLEKPLSIELQRYFEATPERVFDAWVGEDWGAWLPPAQSTCRIVSQDPVAGGDFEIEMTMPDSRQITITGRYIEVIRPSKLAMTWTGSYNNQETLLTISFRPQQTGTVMSVKQQGFIDADLQEGYRIGWSGSGGSFDKLERLLGRLPHG